jgi:hypothetical protein
LRPIEVAKGLLRFVEVTQGQLSLV